MPYVLNIETGQTRGTAMNYYTTEKGKNRTNVYVAATGEFVCQLLNKEVRAWLLKAEKARADEAADAPRILADRKARIDAYLSVRAARNAEAAAQFNLF
jgi:hypothetical protein